MHNSVLVGNPIPSNVDQPQTVDDFIVPLMSKNESVVDVSLEKVQQKIVNIMRSIARVWKALQEVKNCQTLTLSLGEVATNMDMTVLLLVQVFQAAAYHRRFNALSLAMKDHRKLTETLKNKTQECWMLFGDSEIGMLRYLKFEMKFGMLCWMLFGNLRTTLLKQLKPIKFQKSCSNL